MGTSASHTGLTPRGAVMAATAVILVLAGALVGVVELYALAVADLALLLTAGAWVALRRWSLEPHRRLEPARVEAGGTLHVGLEVHNRTGHRSPPVTLHDPFDGGRQTTVHLAPVKAWGSERGWYDLSVPARGRFLVGPLDVVLTDPFGLARTRRRSPVLTPVHAHPRIEVLRTLPVSVGDGRRAGDGALGPASVGDEFYALRPYRVGDDLRRVHWAATARAEELVIRQDQSSQRTRLSVAVDLRADTWDDTRLETGLSAAASVAVAAQRAGLDVRLVCSAGSDSGWVGAGRSGVLLDALAGMVPHPGTGRPLSGLAASSSDTVVLIASDTADILSGPSRIASGLGVGGGVGDGVSGNGGGGVGNTGVGRGGVGRGGVGSGGVGSGMSSGGGGGRAGAGSLTVVLIGRRDTKPGLAGPHTVRLAAGAPIAPVWDAVVGRAAVRSGG